MLSILDRLESEAVHVMREVAAEAARPVLLFSGGKDSTVLLHLALKAFHPAPVPFPLLHVASGWDFRELLAFRDARARAAGLELFVHTNDAATATRDPFTDPELYVDTMLTGGLRQALDRHGFDVAIGGGRRDEERSRAKERMVSVRGPGHRWDPRHQRPEFGRNYNLMKRRGESLRVFPLSNWTEFDVWRYVIRESIELVPLYYAAARPVVERGGALIVVDDERLPLQPSERPREARVRFRTLGCYPLTAAMPSDARSAADVLRELEATGASERSLRAVDQHGAHAMESRKREGYF